MSFADDDDDDEQWLPEPKLDSPVGDWKAPQGIKRSQPPPIFVGRRMHHCQHCNQPAANELFRDGKCLACQAADFLGPME